MYDFSLFVVGELAKEIPFVGIALGIFGISKEFYETRQDRKNYGWAGFLIDLELHPRSVDKPQK